MLDAEKEIGSGGIHPSGRGGDREERPVWRQPGGLNGPIYKGHSDDHIGKGAGKPFDRDLMAGESAGTADDKALEKGIFCALGARWLSVRAFAWKAGI